MSHEMNESELFITMSDEQQELAAGGLGTGKSTGALGGLGDSPIGRLAGTNYLNKMSAVQGSNQSGPGGSGSTSAAVNQKISTSSIDKLLGGFGV